MSFKKKHMSMYSDAHVWQKEALPNNLLTRTSNQWDLGIRTCPWYRKCCFGVWVCVCVIYIEGKFWVPLGGYPSSCSPNIYNHYIIHISVVYVGIYLRYSPRVRVPNFSLWLNPENTGKGVGLISGSTHIYQLMINGQPWKLMLVFVNLQFFSLPTPN